MTRALDDGNLLATPFELPWDEVRASDIMVVNRDGGVVSGQWSVSPALRIHVELHRERDEVKVAVHSHPHYSTLWADAGRIPPVYEQSGGMVDDEHVVIFDEFVGTVETEDAAKANVYAMGDAPVALLRHHGAFVAAPDIRRAYFLCTMLEWRSRIAWEMEALGGVSVALPEPARQGLAKLSNDIGGYLPNIWEAAARREIRRDPTVLS